MNRSMICVAFAASMCGVGMPAFASEASSDGLPPEQNLNFYHVPGADQAINGTTAPLGGGYLFLAGSAFTPRTSSQSVTYPGGGCSFSDAALTTSLELPDNAIIQGVRLYYFNSGSVNTVRLFLTIYPGDGSLTDLLSQPSTTNTGFASEYFPLATPAVIDTFAQSYVLTATTGATTRLCGMRVFYSP